jgi:superkiller protein 3
MELGILYVRKGNYDKAVDLFQRVVREEPGSAEAHNNLGVAYLGQDAYEAAERAFQAAMRIDSGFVLPYYNLACVYARQGLDVDAIIYLRKAVERDERARLWAKDDEDFASLRSDVIFQELVNTAPGSGGGATER